MVYAGKIYETDGAQAIAVHEAADVRPLAPVQNVGSIRFFRNSHSIESLDSDLEFFYSNPAALAGPGQIVNWPIVSGDLIVEPYIAAVVVQPSFGLDTEQADDVILGLTIVNVIVARDVVRRQTAPGGRSHDIAVAFGPVLTTPEELEEALLDFESGRRYKLEVVVRINGEERAKGSTEDLEFTLGRAISHASASCQLRAGDLIAIGPLVDTEDLTLEPGDEVHVAIERLGTLFTKINETP